MPIFVSFRSVQPKHKGLPVLRILGAIVWLAVGSCAEEGDNIRLHTELEEGTASGLVV